MLTRDQILHRAETGQRENRNLDFKSVFDPAAPADWCEIIKDMIALANSGGGAIVVGLNDDATSSGFDVRPLLDIDGADVTNRIQRYTGFQFADFELVPLVREGNSVVAIVVLAADVPIVFQKPGTYQVEDGRQKTAFSQGTVYFRHGSKSEPGCRDDLLRWRDEEVAARRKEWMRGVKQVIEAPRGSTFQVVAPRRAQGEILDARIGNDPNALVVRLQNPEEAYPHRQSDVIRLVNERLPGGRRISTHDIQCIRAHHDISPSYSR